MHSALCPYDLIVIIYNPNSTGPAKVKAERLKRLLVKKYGPEAVNLQPTQYPGHAAELAYQIVTSHQKPLIISVSGDGGYHEVINGVVKGVTKNKTLRPVVAVEGAGNANDHYRHMRGSTSLYSAIINQREKELELIKVSVSGRSKKTLYAHSYWGIGLTSMAIDTLNKQNLNPVKEKVIAMKELAQFKPFTIIVDYKKITVNNVIAAKIGRMAKLFKFHPQEKPAPVGMMRVVIDAELNKASMISKVIKGITKGLQDETRVVSHLRCTMTEDYKMQLDGEVYTLRVGDTVTVSISRTKLLTL
jgi:diacylglycerol kinase family enzyme